MSFFRNLRSSMTRGKSSSRDTTPVRNSRPGSVISNATGRRESTDSRADSLFNRSETFILGSDQEDKNHSNTSTLEKKSKKSKVLSKFSTFTKRKKTPSPDQTSYEHHPSDNATNTYYKWKTEGNPNQDYDAQTDPFHFLYEPQTNRKSQPPASSPPESLRSHSTTGGSYDSATYRKGKIPTQLREQLEQLKTDTNPALHEEVAAETEADKYKTVTLNTFRKSFRDKFLQQQNDVPHNPAWFVEVEPPAAPTSTSAQQESKENRPDFLVFKNENFRPDSRSPVRERNGRQSRSNTRSPVKRNETFRVERPTIELQSPIKESRAAEESATPSIRIEFKNSITPHMPGRLVPVGVAKPMPSQYPVDHYHQRLPVSQSKSKSPNRSSLLSNWSKPITVSPVRNQSSATNLHSGRYQTLVQIRNDGNTKFIQPTPLSTRGRHSTRVQLGGTSPTTHKRLDNAVTHAHHKSALSSYEILKNSTPSHSKAQKYLAPVSTAQLQFSPKPRHHTYFGDSQLHPTATTGTSTTISARTFGASNYVAPASKSHQQPYLQSRHPPSAAMTSGGGGGYLSRRDQHRIVVPVQRRSRSPIKMPWR